jgi:tetratricopeptide (TPR) repeat protein
MTTGSSSIPGVPAVEQLLQHAVSLHQQGQLREAEQVYRQALQLDPAQPHALHWLGVLLHQSGRGAQAVELIEAALQIDPSLAEAYCNLGVVLQALGHAEAAYQRFSEALRCRPDYPEAFNNRGNVLRSMQRLKPALLDFQRALQLRPGYPEAWNNCGNVLRELDHLDAALAAFEQAVQIAPAYAEAWNNRGTVLKALRRHDEALESFARALAVRPVYADAHFNESLCRLLLGDFAAGWAKHEWRWEADGRAGRRREFAQPLWLGVGARGAPVPASDAALAGKTILLHAEQGYGDTLQFCRYVSQVAALGARVILEVQPALQGLLRSLPGVVAVYAQGDSLPAFDFHCPLLSLPLALGTELATIPAALAYLHADPAKVAAWAARLGARTKPRVGLVWSGNPAHRNDRRRSIPLARLAPLLTPALQFISLQTALPEAERAALARLPVLDVADGLHDFEATAALMAGLDYIVTVDTSCAHLAGALGCPATVLLPHSPDFRWLLERDDTPWYPSLRLVRQAEPGVWEAAIERVAAQLASLTP